MCVWCEKRRVAGGDPRPPSENEPIFDDVAILRTAHLRLLAPLAAASGAAARCADWTASSEATHSHGLRY
jgi:hypothetical protein